MIELSIVIPAYNEAKRLLRTLSQIREFLGLREVAVELIIVDDGSTDGTIPLLESWRDQIPQLRVLRNGSNRGKGLSVRHGMLEARGHIALFTDADLSTPIEEAEKLISALGRRGLFRRLGLARCRPLPH
jgi:glycosyltransferase involved in cell wall biosynthesis